MTRRGWFPGHVAVTRRALREHLARVDGWIEVADARAPKSTRDPALREALRGRPCLVVLTRADLADSRVTAAWERSLGAVAVDAVRGTGVAELKEAIRERVVGRKGLLPRVMVVGMPNTGKSSLVNRLVGRRRAPTGDRPGITRGPQWVQAEGFALLDLPGVVPPPSGANPVLAALGVVPLEHMDPVAVWEVLASRGVGPPGPVEEVLAAHARAGGMLRKGGEPDLERAAVDLIRRWQEGRLGRVSLEAPEEGDAHADGARPRPEMA